jgi:single-stranded DNA-binding protein
MKLGAWVKEGQFGKFFSIKVNNYKKPAQQQQYSQAPKPQSRFDNMDDDIPF